MCITEEGKYESEEFVELAEDSVETYFTRAGSKPTENFLVVVVLFFNVVEFLEAEVSEQI